MGWLETFAGKVTKLGGFSIVKTKMEDIGMQLNRLKMMCPAVDTFFQPKVFLT